MKKAMLLIESSCNIIVRSLFFLMLVKVYFRFDLGAQHGVRTPVAVVLGLAAIVVSEALAAERRFLRR